MENQLKSYYTFNGLCLFIVCVILTPDTPQVRYIYTPDYTVYTPDYTIYTPDYTVYTPDYTVYTPDYTVYTPDYTVYTPDYTVYTPDYTVYTPDYTVYTPDSYCSYVEHLHMTFLPDNNRQLSMNE